MLHDLNTLIGQDISSSQFDVCIVGAGAAGITLAIEFEKVGLRVALCEAGGDEYSDESQACYKGSVTGDPYFDLDAARLRFLGGTTNHWGGWCRSFDEVDFRRDYLGEHYKWPIDYEDIAPYRKVACDMLEVHDDFEFENQTNNEDLKEIKFQFSPPVRFREKYKKKLVESNNVSLILNANLIDLHGDSGRLASAGFQSYNNNYLTINAFRFVFAMGGIENSRFLLWFASKYRGKFFDATSPIGKYWMEHPHFTLGQAIVNSSASKTRYYSLTGKAQTNSRILNCGFRLHRQSSEGTKAMIKELLCVAPNLGEKMASLAGKNLVCGVTFRAAWEQAPDVSNAVTLSKSVDRFGVPKVDLKWQQNLIDRQTVKESVRLFNNWLMKKDLGRIQLQEWMIKDLPYPTNDELAGNHHMGGTRMSDSLEYGVVDSNCKVFGSDNLYMAGSSIFTTGGHMNPTLSIVQFALRLAKHIRTKADY